MKGPLKLSGLKNNKIVSFFYSSSKLWHSFTHLLIHQADSFSAIFDVLPPRSSGVITFVTIQQGKETWRNLGRRWCHQSSLDVAHVTSSHNPLGGTQLTRTNLTAGKRSHVLLPRKERMMDSNEPLAASATFLNAKANALRWNGFCVHWLLRGDLSEPYDFLCFSFVDTSPSDKKRYITEGQISFCHHIFDLSLPLRMINATAIYGWYSTELYA